MIVKQQLLQADHFEARNLPGDADHYEVNNAPGDDYHANAPSNMEF